MDTVYSPLQISLWVSQLCHWAPLLGGHKCTQHPLVLGGLQE